MQESRSQPFGRRMRVERKKLNLSQHDVAEFLSVARQSVSAWETGATNPSGPQIAELATLFCCCAHTLLFGESHQEALLRKLMPDLSTKTENEHDASHRTAGADERPSH